jgi:hypothetical protein
MIEDMPDHVNRRGFLRNSAALSGGLAFEHQPLLARMQGQAAGEPSPAGQRPPQGSIGKLKISRLICGGNLFSGFAHSGDLLYVSRLLRHYFQEDKILDTLQLCEESGINTAILRTDDHIVKVLRRYRRERGGKIQWIAQTYPKVGELKQNIQLAIDQGAVGAFIMGGNAEAFVKEGRVELMGEVVDFIKQNGLIAGIGAHRLAILRAVEAAQIEPDFHFKTVNSVGYESESPAEIAAHMKSRRRPWIAFKVLGAGRMQPRAGFDLAFKTGADFVNVGMYDFQVREDVALASEVVAGHAERERPWCG